MLFGCIKIVFLNADVDIYSRKGICRVFITFTYGDFHVQSTYLHYDGKPGDITL
jgi:hypothetical protein